MRGWGTGSSEEGYSERGPVPHPLSSSSLMAEPGVAHGPPQWSQNGGSMRSIASQHGPHRGSRRRGPSRASHTAQRAGKTRSSAAVASLRETPRDNGGSRGRGGGGSSRDS